MEEYSEKLEGKLLSEVNPADFLNLIRNAETVITDSFHATVFSIIFHKNFWCFGRNAGTYNMNTRLHTLLGYVEMQDRMIAPEDLKNKTHCIQMNIPFIKIWAGPEYGASYAVALLLIIPVTVPLIQNLGIEMPKSLHLQA